MAFAVRCPQGVSDIFQDQFLKREHGRVFLLRKSNPRPYKPTKGLQPTGLPVAKGLCPCPPTHAQLAGLTQPSVCLKIDLASSPAELPWRLLQEFHIKSYSFRDVLGFALAALLTQLTIVRMFKMPSIGMIIPGWEM